MLKDLIERCIVKDEAAWAEFVKNFQEIVSVSIRLKFLHLGSDFCEEDIKDVSQKVFSDIWHKDQLKGLRDKRRVRSWISIVAQNAAVSYITRDNFATRRFNPGIDPIGKQNDILKNIASKVTDPARSAENKELQEIVDSFLDELTFKKKIILTLSLIYDKTHKEIAKTLGISIHGVSSTIRRVKKRLKRHLSLKGYEQ